MTQAPDHTAAVAHLRAADATLGGIIDRLGPLERKWAVGTPFEALVRSIMNQQLAVAAAAAIHRRLIALMPGGQPTPEAILALGIWRAAGNWLPCVPPAFPARRLPISATSLAT